MGRGGTLPWHLPEDLKHFKRLTLDKPVIMGRKTFEAIGKPLPKRRNIVLTRDTIFSPAGVETARSVNDVFDMTAEDREIAIIGGAEIFNEFAPFVDTAFVTEIDVEIPDGDVHYVAPERKCVREVIGSCEPDERNAYGMTFIRCDYASADVTGGSLNES